MSENDRTKMYRSWLYQIEELENKLEEIDDKITTEELDNQKGIAVESIIFVLVFAGITVSAVIFTKFILIWILVFSIVVVSFLIYVFLHYNERRKADLEVTRLIEERLRYELLLEKLPRRDEVTDRIKNMEGPDE